MQASAVALARCALAFTVSASISFAAVAAEAKWPTKPIRLIERHHRPRQQGGWRRLAGARSARTHHRRRFTHAYSTPEEYRKRFEKDVARWKDVVKKANIKIDVIG